jgi:lipid A ethanolaminephosphotransferase
VVLVLHQMGSHGPAYHLRSPAAFKRFVPECADNDLQTCSRAALVNAYDNSIAYTDHFLSSTIDWLKQHQAAYDPAMVYVADHGESLGENNLYLHGMPYMIAPDVQKHVPWITWTSPGFAQRTAVGTTCLRDSADRPVSHDNYFHSVLGLLGIQTGVYQRALDVYAPCALAPTDEVAGKPVPAVTARVSGLALNHLQQ